MSGVIAVTFLALAAWFVFEDNRTLDREARRWIDSDRASVADHPSTRVVVRPVRKTIIFDPPEVKVGAYQYKCNECHRLFESAPETPRKLVQHMDVNLQHGLNDRCFNCHDRRDRNRLVLHSGETIGFGEVPRLCAKCHGPTYRDWQNGVHGRTDGYWNAFLGPTKQRVCTECHDPHSPAYGQMNAFPPAEGLRVHISPEHEEEVIHERSEINPLRRWELQDDALTPERKATDMEGIDGRRQSPDEEHATESNGDAGTGEAHDSEGGG